MTDRRTSTSQRRGLAIDGELWDVAVTIARQRVRGREWLKADVEDLASHALTKLHKAAQRDEINNHEGYLSRVIRNRVIDLALKRDAEARHLVIAQDELPIKAVVKGGGASVEVRRRGGSVRGLSLEVIQKEERELTRLLAGAIVAVMPNKWDRLVLADRIYGGSSTTIADLARRHGKTPNVMTNYLRRVLGNDEQPGAVASVKTMLDNLSVRQADAYVRVLVGHTDELELLSDPFAAAIGHLEVAASYSAQHRHDAQLAIARLNWLRGHFPNKRGLPNQILRRLVSAACLYVVEQADANHDRYDRGLADDAAVLTATFTAVQRHTTRIAVRKRK